MNNFREFSRQYNDYLMHASSGDEYVGFRNTLQQILNYYGKRGYNKINMNNINTYMDPEEIEEMVGWVQFTHAISNAEQYLWHAYERNFGTPNFQIGGYKKGNHTKSRMIKHSSTNDFREFSKEYNDYLMHFGILGMHWGIRRYQNPDGSLTDEGLKRYAGKHRRGLNQDERLLAEKKFNDKKRDIKNKYERNEMAKDEYKEKRKEYRKEFRQERKDIVKRNKQITDPKELESRYKAMRNKAINEIPDYHLKRGFDTANKVLDKIILAKNTIEGGAGAVAGYAMVAPLMTNPAVAAATIAFGIAGSTATTVGMSYLDSRIRNKIRRQFT